jgi:hypothetical protein
VDELLAQAERTQARKYVGRGRLLRAQLAQAAGHPPEADLLAAREAADRLHYFPLRYAARAALAEYYDQRGDASRAQQCRTEAELLRTSLAASLRHPELRQSLARLPVA